MRVTESENVTMGSRDCVCDAYGMCLGRCPWCPQCFGIENPFEYWSRNVTWTEARSRAAYLFYANPANLQIRGPGRRPRPRT